MQHSTIRAFVAGLIVAAGCGDGSVSIPAPATPQPATHFITAKVDGATWKSSGGDERSGVSVSVPGLFAIVGSGSFAPSDTTSLTLLLSNVGGPGTYPLGVMGTTPGGDILLRKGNNIWATAMSGADGTVTITVMTPTRIAGTFSVSLVPLTASATGTHTITDGSFDLEVTSDGNLGPMPDNAGSIVSATLGGASWNAATVGRNYASGIFVLVAENNARKIDMSISGVTGPGTYPFGTSPSRVMTINARNGSPADSYSTLAAGSSGSITITSLTSTRIKGTFTATLGAAPGSTTTGTLAVTSGTFDIGLP